MAVDPTGLAGEDPKEGQRLSSIIALGSSIAGVVGGGLEIGFGISAMLTPTGIGQVGGAALFSMGIGTVTFSCAKMVDAVNAISNDMPVSDISTGYGELAGGGVDRAFGGDGESGQVIGGLLQGLISGRLMTAGLQSTATSGESLLFGAMGDGMRNATLGLEVVSNAHSVAKVSGVIQANTPKSDDEIVTPTRSTRFEPILIQPDW
jgi:hypothetical protein